MRDSVQDSGGFQAVAHNAVAPKAQYATDCSIAVPVVDVLMSLVLESRPARLAACDSRHLPGPVLRYAIPARPTDGPVAIPAKAPQAVAGRAVNSEQCGRLYVAALGALLFGRDVIRPGAVPLLLAVGVIAKIRAFLAPRIRPSAGVSVEILKRLRFAAFNARSHWHAHLP